MYFQKTNILFCKVEKIKLGMVLIIYDKHLGFMS